MWIDDQVMARCDEEFALESWIPEKPVVVLGRSNQARKEVNVGTCRHDAVPIVKRLGGGGTVLLHRGCLVISLGCWVRDYYSNDRYFRGLNQALIDCFKLCLPDAEFEQRGYSDIVLSGKKLVGTSLFRSRNYLLYQASVLVELQLASIEKYLPHPSAEPDYRKSRSHRDFLMGLEDLIAMTPLDWLEHFKQHGERAIKERLCGEMIPPPLDQIAHVRGRQGEVWELSDEH